jgi:hypothetical protein
MNRAWAPTSAVIYVIALVASVALDGNAPDSGTTSGAKVVAFYTAHHNQMIASAVVVVIAAVFAIVCYGTFREFLSRTDHSRAMATTALVGAAVYAGSLCLSAGAALALTDSTHHLDPATAQTLSLLRSDVNGPFAAAGIALLLGGYGVAIFQSGRLPRWLAWVALAVAVVALIPSLTIVAVVVAAVWTIATSVMTYRRLATIGTEQGAMTDAGR